MNGTLMLYLDQYGIISMRERSGSCGKRLEAVGVESQKCMLKTGPMVSPDMSVMSSRGIG